MQIVSDKTPLIADLKPSGRFVMEDLHQVGGIPAVLKFLMNEGLIDGSALTVTGRTLADNLEKVEPIKASEDGIIRPLQSPIKKTGHLQILYGNVCPEGCVAKITGKEGLQ